MKEEPYPLTILARCDTSLRNEPDAPPGMSSRLIALSLSLLAVVTPAQADVIPVCTGPEGVLSATLETASLPLLQALKERIGEVVPPGATLDATDVVVIGQSRRLIFIWNMGKRWIVATEHGGRG